MLNLSDKTFWQYSVSRYTTGDIAPLALLLQDNHKVNVNVLLLVCWCLENNVIVNLSQLNSIIQATQPSERKLEQHRAKRKAARPDDDGDFALYESLKKEELELERQQQSAIVSAFNTLSLVSIPETSAPVTNVFNASIAALINAYHLRDSHEARRLVSLLVKQLS